ncbi:S1C family serine protease [Amycolatopsis pigmentata]|uniref:S1C family serine protease n=1 Tax=Amycolatopsis pigmentata TaxID=450801 RepID=A0ABW5FZY6_9PSEU
MSHQFPPPENRPYPWPYESPYYPPPPPPRRRSIAVRLMYFVLGTITLTALVATVVFFVGPGHGGPSQSRAWSPFNRPGSGQSAPQSLDTQSVAGKVSPGLVDINTTLGYAGGEAAGTGMVLTGDGEVLTNNHVVEGATRIQATDIGNGRTYSATVIGYDRSEDVAVIKLQGASGLQTVTTGDSSKVAVGDAAAGIGNAGGTGGTPSVAAGTVTALGQSITASDESSGSSEQLTGLIQVKADIESGDSGGPLVNSSGEVIGMDTAASTGYQLGPRGGQGSRGTAGGTGYAIPVNQALAIAHQIESGSASDTVHIGRSAFLGVTVTDTGQAQGQGQGQGQGAAVRQLVRGGPAEGAGLSPGDVITGIDRQSVDSATSLTNVMDTHHPGDRITITWVDQAGSSQSVTTTLAEGPVG